MNTLFLLIQEIQDFFEENGYNNTEGPYENVCIEEDNIKHDLPQDGITQSDVWYLEPLNGPTVSSPARVIINHLCKIFDHVMM